MTDTRARIPTTEWRARPSMSMMACLARLISIDGRLVRVPNVYKVVSDRPKHIGVLYWFPTATGHGLINRGMVDGRGYLTDLGRDAPERYRE